MKTIKLGRALKFDKQWRWYFRRIHVKHRQYFHRSGAKAEKYCFCFAKKYKWKHSYWAKDWLKFKANTFTHMQKGVQVDWWISVAVKIPRCFRQFSTFWEPFQHCKLKIINFLEPAAGFFAWPVSVTWEPWSQAAKAPPPNTPLPPMFLWITQTETH